MQDTNIGGWHSKDLKKEGLLLDLLVQGIVGYFAPTNMVNKNAKMSKNFIKNVCIKFYQKLYFEKDETSKILNNSIITNRKYWDKKIEKKMEFILKRYKKKR